MFHAHANLCPDMLQAPHMYPYLHLSCAFQSEPFMVPLDAILQSALKDSMYLTHIL